MESCTITENTASWSGVGDENGGGVYIVGSATALIMTSCVVSSNSANKNGGGFYIDSATVTIESCTISDNSANYYGGGLLISSDTTTVNLVGCNFFSNSASRGAADVYHIPDWSGVDLNLNFYSLCPGDSFNAGTGYLDCDGDSFYYGNSCDEPKDLSGTSSCIACPFYTPFSCCGATACSASAVPRLQSVQRRNLRSAQTQRRCQHFFLLPFLLLFPQVHRVCLPRFPPTLSFPHFCPPLFPRTAQCQHQLPFPRTLLFPLLFPRTLLSPRTAQCQLPFPLLFPFLFQQIAHRICPTRYPPTL